MKKALITGITGQDGSYLAEFLLEKGYKVVGLKRRTSTICTERINEIYSPTEDDLEFALSIMGIEGSVSKSANGNFKYYFLDGNNNENSITSESSRKIYRERRN